MNSLVDYEKSDDENELPEQQPPSRSKLLPKINAAPEVSTRDNITTVSVSNNSSSALTYNLPYEEMCRPQQGPVDMFTKPMETTKNTFTGHVQEWIMPELEFESRRRTFNNYGYTINPSKEFSNNGDGSDIYIGDKKKAVEYRGASVLDSLPVEVSAKHAAKRRRLPAGEASNVDGFQGPWAGYEGEELPPNVQQELTEEEERNLHQSVDEEVKKRKEAAENRRGGRNRGAAVQTGSEGEQRQSTAVSDNWIEPPLDVGIDYQNNINSSGRECFPVKKQIYTFAGHTKGVNAVRFFPKYGHLLLSGSMDTTVKIWDVYHQRKCMQTYAGHDKAIRDLSFSSDGRRFLSCSYDKTIKLWDTETGKLLNSHSIDRIPSCIKFHPEDDSSFLCGSSDNKIIQFSTNASTSTSQGFSVTRQYADMHTGAVESITFIESGRRFVTSGDDKNLVMWEYNQPSTTGAHLMLPQPLSHAVPSVSLHPDGAWLACQSMDNHVLVFGVSEEKAKLHRKKRMAGHSLNGNPCQLSFSPDGKFLISGDSNGFLFVWDWQTCKIAKKVKAHSQLVMGCEWNPYDWTKVATCSWDGTVKLWAC